MPRIGHGVYFSAAIHGGLLVALVLGLAAPGPFAETQPDAVEVEVVTEKEVAKESKKEKETRKEEPSPPTPPAEAKPQPTPSQETQATASSSPTPPAPDAVPAPAPEKQAEPPPPAQGQYSLFDTTNLAQFYNLRPPVMDFDAPATETAKLTGAETAAFRANLRRCWRQPEGVAPSSRARVVIRVAFTPDGALAAEPTLIEASASRDGPLVYKAALQALSQCQPYETLPRDRYREWKVLDVSFSPQEMAGG